MRSPLKSAVMPALLMSLLLALVGAGAFGLAAGRAPAQPAGRGLAAADSPARGVLTTAVVSSPTPATALPATAAVTPADTVTATATVTATDVFTDPFLQLDVFGILPEEALLAKVSRIKLTSDATDNVLLTASLTRPQTNTLGLVETTTVGLLAVLRYDEASSTWKDLWESARPGTPGQAEALPDMQGDGSTRYQGGDLLRTGQPILLLRTYEAPKVPATLPVVHLRLWAWTGASAVPLRMTDATGADREADFTGASDVQTADLDDDGVIEIIVDSGPTTTIYRWDKDRFVVRP
jgi:hypothetical protein